MEIAKIIGSNIEKVIKESSMSLEECSNLIGVTRQTLNKYIKGETPIDSAKLFILAKAFNKSIKFFISENEERLCFMFRADNPKKNFDNNDYNYINDKFNKVFNVLQVAKLDKVIVTPESYKVNIGNKISDEDKEIIKEIAEKERKSFGMMGNNLSEIYSALERRNINIISLEYEKIELDAISAYSPDKGAFIFINDRKDIPEERKVFSLIHEYAHLLLHRDSYSENQDGNVYSSARTAINEKVANTFASYFLIQRDLLKEESKVYRKYFDLKSIINLKKKFGVSAKAILLALKEEKIIAPNIYGYLNKQLNEQGYSESEPSPIIYQEKNEKLYYLLKALYLDERITSNLISDLLDLDLISCRKLVKEWSTNEC